MLIIDSRCGINGSTIIVRAFLDSCMDALESTRTNIRKLKQQEKGREISNLRRDRTSLLQLCSFVFSSI